MKADRRWLEWGKNLLIVLLTLSALYLLSMLPIVQDSGLLEFFSAQDSADGPSGGSGGVTLTAAALPASMVVSTDSGRYGVQYDPDGIDELFARFGPLLGEALTSAGDPETITESRWRSCLTGVGVCFDFVGDIPLSALGGWFGVGGQCGLDGSARRLLLSAGEEDQVRLCWRDVEDGLFYSCSTALTRALHLDPILEGYAGNGACFAFEDRALSALLDPYTLIADTENDGVQYAAATPVSGTSGADFVLSALSFSSQNHARGSGGEFYLDGSDRLQVGDDGTVTYQAVQGEKYPVSAAGSKATVAEVIEAARSLAQSTIGASCGEAQLYLISARAEENGWRVRFGYRLRGSAVYLYNEGWAAEFLIQQDYITDFTLHFRNYASIEETTLLLPIDRAAVMLPDLTDEPRELAIQYRDRGGQTVFPMWVAS